MADTKASAFTAITAAAASDGIPIIDDYGGTPLNRIITVRNLLNTLIYWADAAPASPVADDLWWETDTGILWTYGTYASASRWVSVNLYTCSSGSNTAVASANTVFVGMNANITGYDHYIANFYVQGHVITTNSGSHYWKFELRKVSNTTVPASGGTAGTLLGAGVNSSAKSADVWFELTESIDAVVDRVSTSVEIPIIDAYKSGSPGNIWFAAGYTYRLVHP